jgi:hypothetical protein
LRGIEHLFMQRQVGNIRRKQITSAPSAMHSCWVVSSFSTLSASGRSLIKRLNPHGQLKRTALANAASGSGDNGNGFIRSHL